MDIETKIIKPKQWKHWCQRLGLRTNEGTGRYYRGSMGCFYFRCLGRNFRITGLNTFEYSERHDTFDRWANSTLEQIPMPTTFKQLQNFVEKSKLDPR